MACRHGLKSPHEYVSKEVDSLHFQDQALEQLLPLVNLLLHAEAGQPSNQSDGRVQRRHEQRPGVAGSAPVHAGQHKRKGRR